MSADNLIRIKKKENGKYRVTHESASSLAHALAGIEPTEGELLLSIVADDVESKEEAMSKAKVFEKEMEEDGGEVEYGIVSEKWKKYENRN